MKRQRLRNTNGATLTPGQVADLCEVSTNTVKKWCEAGLVRYTRIPNGKHKSLHRRINRESLIGFAMTHGMDFVLEKLEQSN